GGAVARMAAADGVVKSAEIAMVQGVVDKFAGVSLEPETVRRMAEGGTQRADEFITHIREAGGALSDEQREHVVRAALLVAMSDLEVQEDESRFLADISAAMGLTEEKLAAIRGGVENVAQRLIGVAAVTA
ncbi:MAG: TerB family tellurite resistance protein, partial [Caulobacterales bacterium]|nr:TerB family tellurite resistance protein [Caulobacterales bacterium]